MGKLVVVEYVSLDGVMQSPGRLDEDPRGGFMHGGWATSRLAADPIAAQASMGDPSGTAAMLFGRRTYADLVGHWLSTPEPNPFAEILTRLPKYVASRNADVVLPHPNSTLLAGEASQTVPGVKADVDGDLVVLGSGALVRDLAAAGLVDEYVLTTLPVVLGTGTRLFDGTYQELEVVHSITSQTGIVVGTYRVRRSG